MIIDELWEKYQIKLDKFMIGVHNEKTYGLGKHTLIINIYKQINAKLTINVKGDECV
jgi:ribosomal protein L9